MSDKDIKLIIVTGAAKKRDFVMKEREMIIGRQHGCGLRIPGAAVSRQHCRLTLADGLLHVEDLGSANGTLVNGAPQKSSQLRPGDRLTVGPVTFEVRYKLNAAADDRLRREDDPNAPLQVPEALEMNEAPAPAACPAPGEPEPVFDLLKSLQESSAGEADDSKAEQKKKKKKKKKERQEASPDYSVMMKDEGPYRLPNQDNIRNLLAQLEDEAE